MKKCKIKCIISAVIVAFGLLITIFIWLNNKKKNIDCDEYNEDLESAKDKELEMNYYTVNNQDIGMDDFPPEHKNDTN